MAGGLHDPLGRAAGSRRAVEALHQAPPYVNQNVWLRLVENLDRPPRTGSPTQGIVQTTRHECLRLLRSSRQTWLFDPLDAAAEHFVGTCGTGR